MAQGDFWKMAVEVPIKNWRMEYFDQYAIFDVAASASAATVLPADKDSTILDVRTSPYACVIGTTLVLGPSTHANNPGATEEVTIAAIASIPPFTITTSSNLKYDYSVGDQICIRTAPLSWTPDVTAVDGKKYERTDGLKYGNSAIDTGTGYAGKIIRGAITTIISSHWNELSENQPGIVSNDFSWSTLTDIASVRISAIIYFNLSTISSGKKYTLKFYSNDSVNGCKLKIYRVKQNLTWAQMCWNIYKTGNAWDTAGCLTSDVDFYSGELCNTEVSGTGWITVSLDKTLMEEIIGNSPSKPNYGFLFVQETLIQYSSITIYGNQGTYKPYIEVLQTDDSDTTHKISQYTDINSLIPDNGAHRLLAYFYGSGTVEQNEIGVLEYDSKLSPGIIAGGAYGGRIAGTGITTWTPLEVVFTPSAGTSRGLIYAKILHEITEATTFIFDDICLGHAKGTTGTAAGVYTFAEAPVEGSTKYDIISQSRDTIMLNNGISCYDPAGGRIRHWITADFYEASQAFYDNLRILEKYCLQNKNVLLQCFIDDLPQVMSGKFRIISPSKTTWDLSSRSFSIRFEEE